MEDKQTLDSSKFGKLSYRKTGSGPAMVLIHGFPMDSGLWYEIWPSLSANFTVIMPDMPGVGETDFKENLTVEDMAGCVKEILDAENIQKAVIAGHSMGGYVAVAFADLYPKTIAGLSFIHSTAVADDDEKKQTRMKAIDLIQKGGKEAFIKQMIPNLFSPAYKNDNPGVVHQQLEQALKVPAEVLVAFYNAMIMRPDRVRILVESGLAVQFIMGKEDAVIPVQKVLGLSRLAGVNFVSLYSDCGHMSMLEQPEKLINDLVHFGKYCLYNNE